MMFLPKRVLLGCTVISLQDTRFVYPCCKVCLCRVTDEAKSRIRCPKCGFTCETQNVDYRFRLSLKVSRDARLFGVTVFGGCLNPFFGITAGGLQRFVESETFKGPPSLQQLLIKAVEDCFIGKCLVFGVKLSGRDAENCLLGEHAADDSVQFVACQVIPPHGALLGVTVFAYLQSLMQVNAPADCSPNAGCQWQEKDSLLGSFDHTLPLCQNSRSSSGNDSSTLSPPWNLVSNLDLCFSLDETRECSATDVSVDDNNSQESLVLQWPNGQSAKFCPFKLSELKHTEHNRSSTFYRSSINAPLISPIKPTPSVHSSKRSPSNQWAVEDYFSQINASFPEKPLFNHTRSALEDAPLSETLGDFVSTEWQIVNQQVLSSSTSKVTPGTPESNALLENNTVPGSLPVVLLPHSLVSVPTPLRDVTNDEKPLKRKNSKRKSFLASKHTTKSSHLSQRSLSCNIKDVVSNRNEGTSVQTRATKKQEDQSSTNEDAYNCSADLFYQSSMNILDQAESSYSDADPRKQDRFADIKVSEPNISSFHFAPSLQSTPIVVPRIQCTSRQQGKLSKKCSGLNGSRKSPTRTSLIGVLHAKNRRGSQLVKPKFIQISDSALGNCASSAGGSELNANMKHTPADSASPTVTNDCSRDLFDSSF